MLADEVPTPVTAAKAQRLALQARLSPRFAAGAAMAATRKPAYGTPAAAKATMGRGAPPNAADWSYDLKKGWRQGTSWSQPGFSGDALLPDEYMRRFSQWSLGEMLGTVIENSVSNVRRKTKGQHCQTVGGLVHLPKVQWILGFMDPAPSCLRTWMEDNMSRELQFDGESLLPASLAAAERKELVDEYLATLQEDGLSPEEEQLRAALLRLLRDAGGRCDMSHVCQVGVPQGNEVYFARWVLLPRSVALARWVEARMAAEIEVAAHGHTSMMRLLNG